MTGRLLRIVAGIALGFAAAEALARAVLPDGNWSVGIMMSGNALEIAPAGYYRIKANQSFDHYRGWFPRRPLRTDARGHRVPAPGVRRPEPRGGEEILILGASYTFGLAMEAERTWPFVFERVLAEEGIAVRVHNGAQPGYGMPHMVCNLEELPVELIPDRVFLVLPDIGPESFGVGLGPVTWHIVQPDGTFSFTPLETVRGWVVGRDRKLRVTVADDLRTMSAVLHRALHRLEDGPPEEEVMRPREEIVRAATALGTRLRASAVRLRAHGCRLHFLLIPSQFGAERKLGPEHAWFLAPFSRAAGAPEGLLDGVNFIGDRLPYAPRLQLGPGGDYIRGDGHYTASGHEKIARAVAAWYKTTL